MTNIDKKKISRSELSLKESHEINEYIKIFNEQGYKQHYQVNNYITDNHTWDKFPSIRSLNDHGKNKDIPGIQQKFFAIICKELNISGAGGDPLDKCKLY